MVPWVAPIDIQVRFLIKAWQRKWFDSIIVLRGGRVRFPAQPNQFIIQHFVIK